MEVIIFDFKIVAEDLNKFGFYYFMYCTTSARNHPGPKQLKLYSSHTNCERGKKTE